MKKQYLLLDYYGNKDYGKRALYILDEQGNRTNGFMFKSDYEDYQKEMKEQGVETVILTKLPNQNTHTMKTKVVSGFAWLLVNDKAKEIYLSSLFELYVLHNDGSESLIESYADLNDALEAGLDIGIEVGHLKDL